MQCDVEGSDQFAAWYDGLPDDLQERVDATVDQLVQDGPALRRPVVGTIKGSEYSNLKELVVGNSVRILFIFDPRGTAILLLGGDKAGQWNDWYHHAIPEAEQIYEQHLNQLREEGLLC